MDDALINGCKPKPGDGVLLAQLTAQCQDSLLSILAERFLETSLKDTDFIVGDFERYLKSSAMASEALRARYTTLILDPLLKTDNPRRLLPILLPFAEATSFVIEFLGAALKHPHWTEPTMLDELGTQIIEPAIKNMGFNDWKIWNTPANEIDMSQLQTLIRLLDRAPCPKLQSQCGTVGQMMAKEEVLDLEAFEMCMPRSHYTMLVLNREIVWHVELVRRSVLWE
jgi:hypothetical protein